jgi:hypothetical protein
MLKAPLGCVLLFCLFDGMRAQADENAVLTGVSVTFSMPKCDDRDHDTKIDMWIEKNNGRFASAFNIAPNQHFDDPGSYGPYPLSVEVPVTKAYFRGSLTKLSITPRGKDTWCTNIQIKGYFSDGQVLTSSSGAVIKVSEANRQMQFVNQ